MPRLQKGAGSALADLSENATHLTRIQKADLLFNFKPGKAAREVLRKKDQISRHDAVAVKLNQESDAIQWKDLEDINMKSEICEILQMGRRY